MDEVLEPRALRMGVIGVGVIGRRHVTTICSEESPAVLVAVADENPQGAEAVAAEHDVEVSPSVPALLDRSDIDAVAIAVPSGLHADVAIAALEAKKHVFLEKPIDVTVVAAERIRDAERASGRTLSISSQRRFAPENEFIKELIQDGRLGKITSATVESPLWRAQDYYDSATWRGTWALDGGGALMNQGVHLVDLALWFLGDAEEVSAYSGLLAHEHIEVEDTIVVGARMRSGALMTLLATTAAYGNPPIRMNIMGSEGSVVIEKGRIVHLVTKDGLEIPAFSARDDMLEQHLDFVRAASGAGGAPRVTSAQAQAAVAFVEAAYQSAREGVAVTPARDSLGAALQG